MTNSLYNPSQFFANDGLMSVYFHDLAVLFGLFLWLLTISISLKGIDQRDFYAWLMFILYGLISGTILIIILPAKFSKLEFRTELVMFVLILLGSALRWSWKHIGHFLRSMFRGEHE